MHILEQSYNRFCEAGVRNFFWPPQFFQIFVDFSPSNCSSSKTVPSFSFSFFFPKSQDPYVLPGQKIVKKAYFWIFIFFDKFSGLYTDLRPRMGFNIKHFSIVNGSDFSKKDQNCISICPIPMFLESIV